MHASFAPRVFETPELLAEILEHLPCKELVYLQRVSRLWQSVLRDFAFPRRLFLEPCHLTHKLNVVHTFGVASHSGHMFPARETTIVASRAIAGWDSFATAAMLNTMVFTESNAAADFESEDESYNEVHRVGFVQPLPSTHDYHLHTVDQSWQDMLITQPPCTLVYVNLNQRLRARYRLPSQLRLYRAAGIRPVDILEALKSYILAVTQPSAELVTDIQRLLWASVSIGLPKVYLLNSTSHCRICLFDPQAVTDAVRQSITDRSHKILPGAYSRHNQYAVVDVRRDQWCSFLAEASSNEPEDAETHLRLVSGDVPTVLRSHEATRLIVSINRAVLKTCNEIKWDKSSYDLEHRCASGESVSLYGSADTLQQHISDQLTYPPCCYANIHVKLSNDGYALGGTLIVMNEQGVRVVDVLEAILKHKDRDLTTLMWLASPSLYSIDSMPTFSLLGVLEVDDRA